MLLKLRQKVNFPRNSHENSAWAHQGVVCGLDEVGRGCLAGPLVVAAVILPPNKTSRMLKDSKLMTEPERLKAAKWIENHAWWSYGIVHHRAIDQHNIYQATLIAMKMALMNLMATSPHKPEAILVDAMPLKLQDTNFKDIPVHHFPKGETLSCSIAAASIMAKVKRDAMMATLNTIIPGYLYQEHKGYATAKHQNALAQHKESIIHRKSFIQSLLTPAFIDSESNEKQQSIC